MINSFLSKLTRTIQDVERIFIYTFYSKMFPPPAVCYLPSQTHISNQIKSEPFSIKDIIGDGFLFAVPKHRRSLEKRLQRKFGMKEYVWKPLVAKKLIPCNDCGHHREAGTLCPNCFKINMDETKAMQEKITSDLGLSPIDKEVIVLYEGEKIEEAEEMWKNKRIVEMPKERPPWFSKNLLQKTTQKPATSTDIEPSELA